MQKHDSAQLRLFQSLPALFEKAFIEHRNINISNKHSRARTHTRAHTSSHTHADAQTRVCVEPAAWPALKRYVDALVPRLASIPAKPTNFAAEACELVYDTIFGVSFSTELCTVRNCYESEREQ